MENNQVEAAASGEFKVMQGVYVGAVMSPEDVRRATQPRDPKTYQSLQRWTMCGDVSPALFAVLRAMRMPPTRNERVTALTGASGLRYCVLTHQVAGFQHRYFAPLFEPRVVTCVQAIAGGEPLGYSLGGEGGEAIVWPSVLGAREFLPLKALCSEPPREDEEKVLQEYVTALQELRDPERIPSLLEGITVRYASVSAIPPKELLERVTARYGVRG